MSNRYKGGVISATPPTLVAGAGASGTWTLEQQMQATAAGLWPVNGPFYIEDVFSTYLYTGNSTARSITNGIDLSTKGGLVWIKNREYAGTSNTLYDTLRGINKGLESNTTGAQVTGTNELTAFNVDGFSLGTSSTTNWSPYNFVSWTFRKQEKFFDVVTFTKSSSPQTISHNLGSTPGCIFIKRTDSTGAWLVAHRGYTGGITAGYTLLNTTDAFVSDANAVTAADSTSFTLGSSVVSGDFVAYLFAHDAGGFGLTGTDNVISCGSFSVDGSGNATVDLGYEPQWVMIKTYEAAANWAVFDNMRGMPVGNTNVARLFPNTSGAESSSTDYNVSPTATGFTAKATGYAGSSTDGFIYIAIRRGPMKVPTDGTSVFSPVTYTGNGSSQSLTAGFPIDLSLFKYRGGATNSFEWFDRLRGTSPELRSAYTYAELATTTEVTSFASNTQVTVGASSDTGGTNVNGQTYILEAFRRAPSFFDEVCYTGDNNAGRAITHNLTVVPEMIIVKKRSGTGDWSTYHVGLGATKSISLNSTAVPNTHPDYWNDTTPTSTAFYVGGGNPNNYSPFTYVAYLFATCAGVSKCGTFTGNGSSQTINCGFTGGARFVMIKATSTTGDWMVADSARGIVSGNDPYLELNNTNAEVTGEDWLDTDSTGFVVNEVSGSNANTNGVTYIFLAIA